MRKHVKKVLITSLIMSLSISSLAYAAEWKQDNVGWWWQEDDGSYPTNSWKEISGKWYYFGADGYMLSNTTTPDGYQVGADGAWVTTNISNQFQLKSQVIKCMNAGTYEELIEGLQNVSQEWSGTSMAREGDILYTEDHYDILADNLPFSVEWDYRQKVIPIEGGHMTDPNEPIVSYGLYRIEGTMSQIFDGLTKSSYTVNEFESMLKKLGATNIESKTSDFDGYIMGIYFRSIDTTTKFSLNNYEFTVSTIEEQGDCTIYVPTQSKVRIEKVRK